MATFYTLSADGTGVVYRSEADKVMNPVPAGVAYRRDFDEAVPANAAIAADYLGGSQMKFSLAGNVVTRDGIPVQFEPDGAVFEAKQAFVGIMTRLQDPAQQPSREDIVAGLAAAFHAAFGFKG